ncbi:MAG: DUF4855 domain-containing protein [Thermoguttaceae bacterium]
MNRFFRTSILAIVRRALKGPGRFALVAAVAAALLRPAAALADGYLRPGTPAVGGVHHLALIYAGNKSHVAWDAEKLLPYVAYVDRHGKPQDWLFDSFLWLEQNAASGVSLFYQEDASHPAVKADWDWLLDAFFDPAHGVGQLEASVRLAEKDLPDKNHRVNLVIAIPMPQQMSTKFGAVERNGPSLNFARDDDRMAAVQWYVRSALERWKKIDAPHVRLAGFYFLRESIESNNRELVKRTAALLHSLNLKFYWIPFFNAEGHDRWRELGIDAMMYQPNYAFDLSVPSSRLSDAAQAAKRVGAGLEIEMDTRAVDHREFRARYLDYLNAGVRDGFMKDALLGYYQGDGLLGVCAASPDPELRSLYDKTYRFLKGTYRP